MGAALGHGTDTQVPEKRTIVAQASRGDRVFRGIVSAGALSSLVLLGLIAVFLIVRSGEIFGRFGLDFIFSSDWTAGAEADGSDSTFGVWAMLVGTILVSVIAVIVALPLAVGAALFIEFYLPERLRSSVRMLVDISAAVPSVVYGLWAVSIFSGAASSWGELLHKFAGWFPLFGVENEQYDRSPFVAGLVLAIMITPIITSVSREVFSQIGRAHV